MADDEKPTCTIVQGWLFWHAGAGWYWMDDEYPEDSGYVGAFKTREECVDHARACGYEVR